MSYQMDLLSECHIAHCTGKWTLTIMYALMCYQTALITECLVTHFTRIFTLTPMYITGISAFSIVYVKLFIQSILVKTQRLKASIYFDRRNNYFCSNVYIAIQIMVLSIKIYPNV